MICPESLLPVQLRERATLRGREFAWPIDDIPKVIEAARAAGLVSIGGQLQFRFPDGRICECDHVDVDAFRNVPPGLPWGELVALTAAESLSQFHELQESYDFMIEGRELYCKYIDEFERGGGAARDIMCFVWYFEAPPGVGFGSRPVI